MPGEGARAVPVFNPQRFPLIQPAGLTQLQVPCFLHSTTTHGLGQGGDPERTQTSALLSWGYGSREHTQPKPRVEVFNSRGPYSIFNGI